MATRRLSADTDNPTTSPERALGTEQADLFLAPFSTPGAQGNTLQSFDTLDGLGGFDRLEADLQTLQADTDLLIRPTLRNIEYVSITAISNDDGTDGDQSDIRLDLGRSQPQPNASPPVTGVRTVRSIDSNTGLEVINAGFANDFVLQNFSADGDEDDGEGLAASGINSATVTATAINVDSAEGDELALIQLDRRFNAEFSSAAVTVTDSQFQLDVGTQDLSFSSTGGSGSNTVEIVNDTTFDNLTVRGNARLVLGTRDLAGNNAVDDRTDLQINDGFNAGNNTGGVEVGDITGTARIVRGSQGDDIFEDIATARSGTVTVDLLAGDDVVDDISAPNAGRLNLRTGTGDDNVGDVSGQTIVISLGDGDDDLGNVTGGTLVINAGDGNDDLGTFNGTNVTIALGSGSDNLAGGFATGTLTLNTGADAAGNFVGTVEANIARVTSGPGSDTFNLIEANAISLALGGGDDQARVDAGDVGRGALTVTDGGGDDLLTVLDLASDTEGGPGAGSDDSVDLGAGDDRLVLLTDDVDLDDGGGEFDTVDTFDGGAGRDRIALQLATGLSVAQGANIVNFETLVLFDDSDGTIELDGVEDVDSVVVQGENDTLSFTGVANNTTFFITDDGNDVSIDAAGSVDLPTVNISVGTSEDDTGNGGGVVNGALDVTGFDTVNLVSRGGDVNRPPFQDANIVNLDAADTETLNISGNEDIRLRSDDNAFTVVDGSAATGNIDMTNNSEGGVFRGVMIGPANATITGGSGDDSLVGGNGADTFNLGQGGADEVLFLDRPDSEFDIDTLDTVNGFDDAGNDTLVFNGTDGEIFTDEVTGVDFRANENGAGADLVAELVFLGNAINFAQAEAAVANFDNNESDEDFGAVFDQSTSTLYIDANSDGALDENDFAVVVNVADGTLSAGDLRIAQFLDMVPV